MAKLLEDHSGPFKPDLTFADFSKDFLLKLMNVWQFQWLDLSLAYWELIREKFGFEAANECEFVTWLRVGERLNPWYPRIVSIQQNTVLDALKCAQLSLENSMGAVYGNKFYIISTNHVIFDV